MENLGEKDLASRGEIDLKQICFIAFIHYITVIIKVENMLHITI